MKATTVHRKLMNDLNWGRAEFLWPPCETDYRASKEREVHQINELYWNACLLKNTIHGVLEARSYTGVVCHSLLLLFFLWCWERLKAKGEEYGRGWDGWMASPIQWKWTWANSGRWWGTGRPGVLQSMGSQRQIRLSDWAHTHTHAHWNACRSLPAHLMHVEVPLRISLRWLIGVNEQYRVIQIYLFQ